MATGSEQQTVRISALARAKVLLHAATHPRSQVHGLLVGKFAAGKGGGGGGGGGGGPLLAVADAVPLFHSCPTKPLLDVALRLVDAHLGGGGRTPPPPPPRRSWDGTPPTSGTLREEVEEGPTATSQVPSP